MKKYKRLLQALLKSIQLQLFISFISLPFLIAWGLPISLLTPVSTLIFGPFLTCFLLISSFIFFLELLYLPNGIFIWCLEHITTIWLACLNLEQKTWLIGFIKPPMLILLLLPFIALAVIHNKKITALPMRALLLGLFIVTTCAALKLFPYSPNITSTIPCNNGAITFIHYGNSLAIIDPGFIAARPSYESFISYTLVPEIIQKTGCLYIDHLVIGKFNKRILDAIQFLATKISIKNLYLPAWKGKIPSFAWQSYAQLKRTITANNGKIRSISYKKQLCNDHHCTLFIEPTGIKDIEYYDATYQPLHVQGTINNQEFMV